MRKYNLRSIFSKSTQRSQPPIPSDSVEKDVGVDVWSEILLNVDPYNIFKYILVSKEWLEVITSSCFRTKYLKKWKGCFPVIGFMHGYGNRLVPTTKLGSLINKTKLMRGQGWLLSKSKSSSGDGLVLYVDPKNTSVMYVFNLAAAGGVTVTPLPLPPASFAFPLMEIISFEDASFKVILADFNLMSLEKGTTLSVQTFCSSTWTWKMSELSCNDSFRVAGFPAIGSSKGMVYWLASPGGGELNLDRFVVYDSNNPQEGSLRLISGPVKSSYISDSFYDIVSPQGNLQCATFAERGNVIKIWSLEENYEWKLSFMVDTFMWDVSVLIWENRFDHSSTPGFGFVSFVPGRPDSIFVARGSHLYIYDARTKVLDKFEDHVLHLDYGSNGRKCKQCVPLTIAESGVWPSSPSSNRPMFGRSSNHSSRNKSPVLVLFKSLFKL